MLEAILNSKKIKYAILKPLIDEVINSSHEMVDIYIDVDTVLKQFFSPQVLEATASFSDVDKHMLSSEIINIAAHYRHFFWSRYGLATSIYFYYSSEKSVYHVTQDSDYKSNHYEKRLNGKGDYRLLVKMIDKNLKLSKLVSTYIPNIFFINAGTIDPSLVPYYLLKNNAQDSILSLVLSNNQLDYQLITHPETSVITLQSDNSKIIKPQNVMSILLKDLKSKNDSPIKASLLPLIFSCIGYKSFNISNPSKFTKVKTFKILEKAILDGIMINDRYPINSLEKVLYKIFDNDLADYIIHNYSLIDYDTVYTKSFNKILRTEVKEQLINKSDSLSLMEVDSTYYRKNPLMLIELMEGETEE